MVAIAFVLGAQDLADFRLVLGEIVEGDETTEPRHIVDQHAGGFAGIELSSAVRGDALESGGEFRLTESISGLKHFAVVQKDPAADGEELETRVFYFEFVGKPFADRKAIFGKANGWGHYVRELHRAIGFQSESEAGDGSWDSDGFVANDRRFLVELAIFADIHVARGFARSSFAIVQESRFTIGKANQHEAAAADVSRRGLDDGQRKSHGNGGVHSVTATLEDLHAGLGAKLLADRLLRPRFGHLGVTEGCCCGLCSCAGRQRQGCGQ